MQHLPGDKEQRQADVEDLEITKLNGAVRKAHNGDIRAQLLRDRRRILEGEPVTSPSSPSSPSSRPAVPFNSAPQPDEPFVAVHPDRNPAWDEGNRVGINYAPMGARRALARTIESGHAVGGNMLDDTIRQYRVAGMPVEEIAQRLQLSVDQVGNILTRLRQRAEPRTPTEIRWLQTERLEAIINALWNMVTNGSVDHIELALKAIERLNKMYELESEKVKIELDYVTTGQADVIFRSCQMAVAAVVQVYEKKLAQAGLGAMDPEIIEGTIADAMDDAAQLILDAQSNPLVLERKGSEMVLIPQTAAAKV